MNTFYRHKFEVISPVKCLWATSFAYLAIIYLQMSDLALMLPCATNFLSTATMVKVLRKGMQA